MQELKVIEKNGTLSVDSREVATMVGKKHKNLLRDISKYIDVLDSSKLSSQEYFVLSKYLNEQNKEQLFLQVWKNNNEFRGKIKK